jgi:NADH:ubiquinone oxidoreductase subunit B-like Fe-S oxidoreductase
LDCPYHTRKQAAVLTVAGYWVSKAEKFKQTLSARKIMATVLWDCKGILLVDFMIQGTTINSESYCETLEKLQQAIQNQ